jgi:hypothetical protein
MFDFGFLRAQLTTPLLVDQVRHLHLQEECLEVRRPVSRVGFLARRRRGQQLRQQVACLDQLLQPRNRRQEDYLDRRIQLRPLNHRLADCLDLLLRLHNQLQEDCLDPRPRPLNQLKQGDYLDQRPLHLNLRQEGCLAQRPIHLSLKLVDCLDQLQRNQLNRVVFLAIITKISQLLAYCKFRTILREKFS